MLINNIVPCNVYKVKGDSVGRMLHPVYEKAPVLAAITDKWGYVASRKEIEKLARERGLSVADVPMILQAMSHHPEVRAEIRPHWIDTLTTECHGLRKGKRSYEVWHSVGSFATVCGLEKAFSHKGAYGFMPLADDEWTAVGHGTYEGKDIARVHLEDVKNGAVSSATPYTVFAGLDTDTFRVSDGRPLTHDAFMRDDRILMISGSLENRVVLATILYSDKEEGGEGWQAVDNVHRIHDGGFEAGAKGRLICLGDNNSGFFGSELARVGRFAAVRNNFEAESQNVTLLEEIKAVINNPDLNREGMAKAVRQLYQR